MRRNKSDSQSHEVAADTPEQGVAQYATLSWNALPSELQAHIANLLPKTEHRSALSRTNHNAWAIVAPLLARDSLSERAAHVTELSELQAILGQTASDGSVKAASKPACLNDLGYSLRPAPLTALAGRLQFMPVDQRTQAFKLICDQIQVLPQRLRSIPFLRLSYEMGDLPNQCRHERYHAFFDEAEDAHREKNMTSFDYSRFLAGAAYLLPSLPVCQQPALLLRFEAAVARLPQRYQALPIASLAYQLGNLQPDVRQAVYRGAWAKTQEMVDSDKVHALVGLVHGIRHLPEEAHRFEAFDQLFKAASLLGSSEQGAPLEHLSAMIETLPRDKRIEGFEKILGAMDPTHGLHYHSTLRYQARNVASLPVQQRAPGFDRVMTLITHTLEEAGKSLALAALADTLPHLSAGECVDRCVDLAQAVMQLDEPHRWVAHRALLDRFPDLTGSEQEELTAFFEQ